MAQFEKGDVVQLTSGGPKMTVQNVGRDGAGHMCVWCAWFDGSNKKAGRFPVETVQEAD